MSSTAPTARPFLSIARGRLSQILLTCEHAGRRLPPPMRAGVEERRVLSSHRGWDIGAWELTRELARQLRAAAIGGRWSRLVVDVNRRVDDPTLIVRRVDGMELSWNADLDLAEVERRIFAYHAPYHEEVDRRILRHTVRGIRPLLLAVHSFTPVLRGRRREFDVGVLYERHPGLAHALGRRLREAGLTVRYNRPYSGMAGMMYAADRHGTHHGLPCLELEVNQGLFGKPSVHVRLGRVVAAALDDLPGRTSTRDGRSV